MSFQHFDLKEPRMKSQKKFILMLLLCSITIGVFAQDPPKRELRATWLAAVGVDFPKTSGAENQKKELIAMLDKLESANLNSVFFHVRPMADAFYKSDYEPWSHYLTGTRGKDPGYDPLEFVIEEAHKRGIEVHAWMNPYRYETEKMNHGSEDYVRKNHPDWILTYSDRRILDPGNPEVRQFIINIVQDVVSKYNVDGVIFDDYYYPYGGTTNQDKASQDKYKDPSMNVNDWRRENVNELIANIYTMIQETKSTVKFSQGPFGIWGANKTIAAQYGIDYLNTSGGTDAYASIYCDAVRWLKDKTIDFLTPQCYWPSTNTNTWGYTTLVPWWSGVAKKMDRHFYSSMRMSTMGQRAMLRSANVNSDEFAGLSHLEKSMLENSKETVSLRSAATDECDYEVDYNRSTNLQDAPGHVFFNTLAFINAGFPSHLKAGKFSRPALTPTMTWKTPTEELKSIKNIKLNGNTLNWEGQVNESDRFAIYLVPSEQVNTAEAYETSAYLRKITWSQSLDVTQYAALFDTHRFALTIVDAHGYESTRYIQNASGMVEDNNNKSYRAIGGLGYIDIIVETDLPIHISIYSILGQKIKSLKLNESTQIPLNSGVYIINGEKIIVK